MVIKKILRIILILVTALAVGFAGFKFYDSLKNSSEDFAIEALLSFYIPAIVTITFFKLYLLKIKVASAKTFKLIALTTLGVFIGFLLILSLEGVFMTSYQAAIVSLTLMPVLTAVLFTELMN